MKKIFSFVAAALMSVSMFAGLVPAPDDETLNGYKGEGDNVVVAIYVGDVPVCMDIVFSGTYNNWAGEPASCVTFQDVEGFEGWKVVTFFDESASIDGKPVQLGQDGTFSSWDYQAGDAEVIRGTAEVVAGQYSGEIDIKGYSSEVPNVLNIKGWKKGNPCTAEYKDYTITFVSPDCNEYDYITPAISGGFNNWAQQAMEMDELATAERQQGGLPGAVYKVTAHAIVGSEYKFRSSEEWGKDWSNELKEWDAETEDWKGFNGGANFQFGEETEITYDLSDPEKYTWTNCDKPVGPQDYDIYLKAPEMCMDITPAIVGSATPGGWDAGTAMTWDEGENAWYIKLEKAQGEFKFYDLNMGWDNEIQQFNAETGEWNGTPNITLTEQTVIYVEYNTDEYRWKACGATGIEEVKAAVKNDGKYFINGTLYIKKGDKMVNVLGL